MTQEEILADLQDQAQRLLQLLKEGENGMFTWWQILNERGTAVIELLGKLGIRKGTNND